LRQNIHYVFINTVYNYINRTANNNNKSPCGPGPTGQCMVHAHPRQGTGPVQHACCVHDEGNGSGAVRCMVPPMEAANRKHHDKKGKLEKSAKKVR
jgi:hypothetical protein